MCGSKNKTTTAKTSPAPEAMSFYRDLLTRLQGLGQTPYQEYYGERVAPFTAPQEQAMQAIKNLQGAGTGTLQQAVSSAQRAGAPITAEDIQRYQNPYQKAVVDAMSAQMRQQEAEDISKLQGTSISSGAFGGDRAGLAQAQLMSNQERERNARISDLLYKGWSASQAAAQAEKEMASRASQQLQSLAGSEYEIPAREAMALYGLGTEQQKLEQAKLDIPYQYFQEQRSYPFQLAQYLTGLGTATGSQMGGVGKTTEPGPSILSQIIGAGISAGSMAMGMPPSDERLKENIEDVGTTHDGQTIYKYNFKGSPMTHIGLLAQEVENKHPEAVGQTAGFKTVNYDLATRDAVRKADGGGLDQDSMLQKSYIPTIGIALGRGAPEPPRPSPKKEENAFRKADGGGLGQTAMFQKGYIPTIGIALGRGAPEPPKPAQKEQDPTHDAVDKAMALANKMMSKSTDPTNPASWQTTTTLSPENPASWNTAVRPVETMSPLSPSMLFPTYAHGGGINRPHYDNGGGTGKFDFGTYLGKALEDKKWENPEIITPSYTTSDITKLLEAPTETSAPESKLPIIEVPQGGETTPSSGINKSLSEGDEGGVSGKGKSLIGGLLGLSPEAEQATMQAGLAMMAGQSPFALSNIGAGGMAGMKYYNELMKAKQEEALKREEIEKKYSRSNLIKTDLVRKTDGTTIYKDKTNPDILVGSDNIPVRTDEIMPKKDWDRQQKAKETEIAAIPKAQSAYNYHNYNTNNMIKRVKDVMLMLDKKRDQWALQGLGSRPLREIASRLGGSEAQSIELTLKSIGDAIGFDALQALKDNSKTGASGLGQLTEKEFNSLKGQFGAIDLNMTTDALLKSLAGIVGTLDTYRGIYNSTWEKEHGKENLPKEEEWKGKEYSVEELLGKEPATTAPSTTGTTSGGISPEEALKNSEIIE